MVPEPSRSTPVEAPPPTWDLHAFLDGYVVRFHGEIVAQAPTFDEARGHYNRLRSQAAMARESLRHLLERVT